MSNEKILVVDDDKEILNLITFNLKNEGYNILKACNGEEALKLVESTDIKLIILDIMMPKVDGMEVCRRVRMTKNIPIIILSAKSSEIDKVIGFNKIINIKTKIKKNLLICFIICFSPS